MKVLITGGQGFIGSALVRRLLSDRQHSVVISVRSRDVDSIEGVDVFHAGELHPDSEWSIALRGVDVVIHTAARVHVSNDSTGDSLSEYRRINVEGCLNLARQAASAGIGRFVFISSIGVNGSQNHRPFTEQDIPNPCGAYAISKLEAEEGLSEIALATGMDLTIVRPPLVYGPNSPGNFFRLMRLVSKGLPLPLGAIHNKRSLVALDNLVDLVIRCIDYPAAANQTFLVGDGEDLSTTELLQKIGKAMGRPARLVPFPGGLLTSIASLLGKKDVGISLCGSLQVDISKARSLLGWEPPVSLDEGLRKAVEDFKKAS